MSRTGQFDACDVFTLGNGLKVSRFQRNSFFLDHFLRCQMFQKERLQDPNLIFRDTQNGKKGLFFAKYVKMS